VAINSDGDGLDMTGMRHALVSARDRDLIVLFVPEITDDEMSTVEHFMEAVSDTTEATLAVLPANVVTDCRNYTLKDLLDLRDVIDDLIADRIGKFPVIEV
tara:strand:- start:2197 stop:2499 length:303 start_codon:yes stop_codon:yes gene_type:complete